MAKIGKFSTGLKGSVKDAGSPYGQSNKGWDARSNMMNEMKTLEPRQRPAPGYVGAAKDPEMMRPRSK
jgi:hypothetical protein